MRAPDRAEVARAPDRVEAAGKQAAAPADRLEGPDDLGLVRPDTRSAPFFAAAADDVLMIRRCADCATWFAPAAAGCPACGDDAELTWARASGRGTLVSWSVVHPRTDGPVAVPALVELAEGPWLAAGLRLADAAEVSSLHAGLPLTAQFVHPADGASYPVFRPGRASAPRAGHGQNRHPTDSATTDPANRA